MQPLIYLKNVRSNKTLSIYEDGRVYGSNYGELLGILSDESLKDILNLINENMYMFKTLTTWIESLNPVIMHVRDDSRKHRKITLAGWSQIPLLQNLIRKTDCLKDVCIL